MRRSNTLLKLNAVFTSRKNMLKVGLGVMIQVLVQWGGPGAIATYANRIMTLVGASDKNGYVMSVGFGATKLGCGILSAFFLVDLLGRRKTLLCGVLIQGLSMLYVAIFLGLYVQGNHTRAKRRRARLRSPPSSCPEPVSRPVATWRSTSWAPRSLRCTCEVSRRRSSWPCTICFSSRRPGRCSPCSTRPWVERARLPCTLPSRWCSLFPSSDLPARDRRLPLEEIDQVFERPVWQMARAARASPTSTKTPSSTSSPPPRRRRAMTRRRSICIPTSRSAPAPRTAPLYSTVCLSVPHVMRSALQCNFRI